MNDIFRDVLFWLIGFVIGVITLDILIFVFPETTCVADKLLNSGKYTIDTTMIVHHNDTSYTYKYIEVSLNDSIK